MVNNLLSVLALVAAAAPGLAQRGGPPIKIPGLGECLDACHGLRDMRGALLVCCGDPADGCVDCAPECVATCGNGAYGSCTDLRNTDETCTTGCDLLCQGSGYTVCSVGGRPLDPTPEGCP